MPFDFKMRRQLDAFFDIYGGKIGKDILVKEENLYVDLTKVPVEGKSPNQRGSYDDVKNQFYE